MRTKAQVLERPTVADLLEGAGLLWDQLSAALFGGDRDSAGSGGAPATKAPFQASFVGKEFEIDDAAAQVRNDDGTPRRYAAGDTIPAGKKAGDPTVGSDPVPLIVTIVPLGIVAAGLAAG